MDSAEVNPGRVGATGAIDVSKEALGRTTTELEITVEYLASEFTRNGRFASPPWESYPLSISADPGRSRSEPARPPALPAAGVNRVPQRVQRVSKTLFPVPQLGQVIANRLLPFVTNHGVFCGQCVALG